VQLEVVRDRSRPRGDGGRCDAQYAAEEYATYAYAYAYAYAYTPQRPRTAEASRLGPQAQNPRLAGRGPGTEP
jgi:hypothetical protein